VNWRIPIALLTLLGFLIALWMYPIPSFADALRGFATATSMLNGGEFNHLNFVNPHRPDELLSVFVAWWTPGQYLAPMVFYLFGSNWILAQKITLSICLLVGVYGWVKLWKTHFPQVHWSWLLLLLVLNRNFYWHTLLYMGGDVLLFSILPYFFHHALKGKNFHWFLPLWLVVGFTAKAAFIVFAIPVVIWRYRNKLFTISSFIEVLPTAAVSIALWFFFLQMGDTPTSNIDMEGYGNLPHRSWNGWLYAFSAPVASPFWLWSGMESLWKTGKIPEYLLYAVFGSLAIISIMMSFPKNTKHAYRTLAFLVFIFVGSFFALQQMRWAAISFEARHFYPVGLLMLPIIVEKLPKAILPLIFVVSLTDVARYPSLKKKINAEHCESNGLFLPYCAKYEIPKTAIIITDVWDALPGFPHTHKVAIEPVPESKSFRVLTGIEQKQSIEFEQFGVSNKPKIGFFFKLDEAVVQHLNLDNLIILEKKTKNSFSNSTKKAAINRGFGFYECGERVPN
jgi:hypothetical protein